MTCHKQIKDKGLTLGLLAATMEATREEIHMDQPCTVIVTFPTFGPLSIKGEAEYEFATKSGATAFSDKMEAKEGFSCEIVEQ